MRDIDFDAMLLESEMNTSSTLSEIEMGIDDISSQNKNCDGEITVEPWGEINTELPCRFCGHHSIIEDESEETTWYFCKCCGEFYVESDLI